MITHMSVDNYQSIGHADLDFGQVNVIVGPPNHGKSALMRALLALITNQTGSDFIRKGETECKVTVELDTGHMIQWVKTEKTAEYAIFWPGDGDTTVYDKLAGNVPEDVQKLLGIHPIVVDKDFSIMPQVHDQWDQPMLLRESSSRVARALARTTKLDSIMQAQTAAARSLRSGRSGVKSAKEQMDNLTQRQSTFRDLAAMDAQIKDADARFEALIIKSRAINSAEKTYSAFLAAQELLAVPTVDPALLEDMDKRLLFTGKMLNLVQNLEAAEGVMETTAYDITGAMHECADTDQEIGEILGHMRICPVCNQEMP